MVAVRMLGRTRTGGPATVSVAGSESNVAIGLARLGHAAAWVGAVGADELGELVLRTLRGEGVDVSHVHRHAGRPTGVMVREQRTAEAVHVDYARAGSAGAHPALSTVRTALAAGADHLHVSGVTAALSAEAAETTAAALRLARTAGVPTSLDVNHRARLWDKARAQHVLGPLVRDVDVLFASVDELPLVLPDGLAPDGPLEVVITDGARGATVRCAGQDTTLPANPVVAVDVVGAGDAFVAGYLSARLDGLSPPGRLRRGTDVAGIAVGSHGDWEGLPTREELVVLTAAHDGTLR